MFLVRYEHHPHIKTKNYLRNRTWRPICMFPVRYEHHLHKKTKFIPVTDHAGLNGYLILRIQHCLHNRLIDGAEVV
jgi:hypothetical protein